MWALRAWSIISTGTSSLWAKFHSRLSTLWAITPSLSSSASRRINSSNFSLCFLLALVQLSYKNKNDSFEDRDSVICGNASKAHIQMHSAFETSIMRGLYINTIFCMYKIAKASSLWITLKQSKRWSSCSGEKSHASFARRSWTFLTIASCFPAWGYKYHYYNHKTSLPQSLLIKHTF